MHITCLGCGKQLPISEDLRGTQIRCDRCQTLAHIPTGSQPINHPFPVQPTNTRGDAISNQTIVVTALSCAAGLVLVVLTSLLVSNLTQEPPVDPAAELAEAESKPKTQRTKFQEGYSIMLPEGFKQQSRNETERGYIVYRFRTDEGYRFTFAIVPNESVSRLSSPPREYSKTMVKGVRELSEGGDNEVAPTRITVGSMPATVFRFWEKETFRGITFTYCMVVMDHGRKLVLKFSGKYGGYTEQQESIRPPDHWYDALLSFETELPPR